MGKAGRIIKFGLFALIGVYLCVLGLLYFAQDALLFPAPTATQENLPDYAQIAEMRTQDGNTLRHIRLASEEGAPKVMFFHGNGSLAAHELNRGRMLQENGFDVLLVEYRGYGGSTGTPSASAFLKDSLAVYDWYKSEESDWVFLYAHSLGTGIAAYVSANRPIQSMVLEAPYPALSDVAASKYPIFPVHTLFKHEIKTSEYLKDSKTPTLIIHGKQDGVIELEFGQKVFENLNPESTSMEIIEDASHNNLASKGSIDMALGHFSRAF